MFRHCISRAALAALVLVICVFIFDPYTATAQETLTPEAAGSPMILSAPDIAAARELFPMAETLIDNGDGSWRVTDISGNHLGDVLSGNGGPAGITGYAGPTPLVMGVDPDGAVKGIHLLPNSETPGFQVMFSSGSFLKAWNGLSLSAALTAEVDTVSGATMSTGSIRDTARAMLSEHLKKKVKPRED